ncbi:MAG: carbohydrate ABC transporter permease, partial [Candidatus Fimadaptatus sp.]
WNSYFNALMYIRSSSKFPLQLVLRQILVLNEFNLTEMTSTMVDDMIQRQFLANLLKYSVIVVSSVPVMLMYPFIQKHFVKGVMLGSLKG